MSISMSLYLIDLIDNMNNITAMFFIISFIALLPSIAFFVEAKNDSNQKTAKLLLIINTTLLLSCLTAQIIIPSRKTMQLILINESLQKLAQQPKVEQLSDKLFKVLEVQLDKLSDTKKVEESK